MTNETKTAKQFHNGDHVKTNLENDPVGTVVRVSQKSLTVYMNHSHRWLKFRPENLELINDNDVGARAITPCVKTLPSLGSG